MGTDPNRIQSPATFFRPGSEFELSGKTGSGSGMYDMVYCI